MTRAEHCLEDISGSMKDIAQRYDMDDFASSVVMFAAIFIGTYIRA